MTISGQLLVMKRVGVAELKASLSRYLAKVRGGERVMVCDRNTPIAWLTPYDGDTDDFVVLPPSSVRVRGKVEPLKLRRRVDVVELLRESRDQR